MEGELSTAGDVSIGENGKARLELKARQVTVAGCFEGAIEADGRLELKRSGVLSGRVKANRLIVDVGALFSGSMAMNGGNKNVPPLPGAEAGNGEEQD